VTKANKAIYPVLSRKRAKRDQYEWRIKKKRGQWQQAMENPCNNDAFLHSRNNLIKNTLKNRLLETLSI
jgi:hypothetical protein